MALTSTMPGESLLRDIGSSSLSTRAGQERGNQMLPLKTRRKFRLFSAEAPEAISLMLADHPELKPLPSLEQRAQRLTRLLGCGRSTAVSMLNGAPAGKDYWLDIVAECGGLERLAALCARIRERRS